MREKYEQMLAEAGFEPWQPVGEWRDVFADSLSHVTPRIKNGFIIGIFNYVDSTLTNEKKLWERVDTLEKREKLFTGNPEVNIFIETFQVVLDAVSTDDLPLCIGIDWMEKFINLWAKDNGDAPA